ncbi:MAG: glycosyltransferase family protein [Longimonas sp.]|uniref:glycosyltransferase family protein n=1 Tax=Longimonas sp. TaxID=2039626 RepID=UPI0033524C4A
MRCLFVIQGEGRGHLTQALTLYHALQARGHHVVEAVVGHSRDADWPAFFVDAMPPITPLRSLTIATDPKHGHVRPVATLARGARRVLCDDRSLDTLQEAIERTRPDIVVNFFEPMLGVLAARRGISPPIVAVAHQYMFLHSGYRFPPGHRGKRVLTRWFTRLTAWGASARIALSLYPAPDSPASGLIVVAPLVRPLIRQKPTVRQRNTYLQVYLMNRSYAKQIMRWHKAHPQVPLRCFWARPGIDKPEHVDRTLTIYPLSNDFFVTSMAGARGLACTSGFESVAEAMYLNTPVQVVPVANHYEQLCNAYDTVRSGAGVRADRFDLSSLLRHSEHSYTPHSTAYRDRVQHAPVRIVRCMEQIAEDG